MEFPDVYINANEYFLGEIEVSNQDLLNEYPKLTEKEILDFCAVKKRFASRFDQTASDLGIEAAKKLLNRKEIDKDKIDYIIFISDALDHKGPTTACYIQRELGLSENCGAIDILHGCTGFIYGLNLAKSLIYSQTAANILVITADNPTKVIHPADVQLRMLFSDGAAATLVSKDKIPGSENFKINQFVFGTDGKGFENLIVHRSGTRNPADISFLEENKNVPSGMKWGRMEMNSAKIFLFAFRRVPQLIKQVTEKHGLTIDDIDYFIFHQANGVMLEFLRKKLKIPESKFIVNIENTGNTVSATIPIAMNTLPKLKNGDKVLLAGFGIGYTWGATIVDYSE
ncbi:MAG TPA: 3-oxoacyl-ACP synthase [Flavobacteriales bacterium]|nr:3-oxoacyl-ACP synthase [Flavobacteriales bacterium]|tara:strand:+ start:9996 stop:11021 length:1026 start_codon:yes stop_codon:yes gene_type:complete